MAALFKGVSNFFGLDIGTSSVRLVELRGGSGGKTLAKYAYVPLEGNISQSDSKGDQQKLMQTVSQLVKQSGVGTKNVAVGIPSSRVFTTVADVDRLPHNELAKAIKYQADALIPTPLAESKIDWALIGDSPTDKAKQEILLSSVPNKFVEDRLDILESIGLNVVAFEPDNLAMARSLAAPDSSAQLILDVGRRATDLVVILDGVPHLTRSIPTGVEAFIKAAAQNLNIDEKQAEQFIFKFGLSKDKLEGQVLGAITGTVDILTTELEKSIKFFQTRYSDHTIQRIIVTGGASVMPEFPLYLANKYGINVEIGNAWRNVSYSRDRQNELSAISNQFGVAVGAGGAGIMIEFNLLPDVKLEYIRSQRTRNLVISVAVLISAAAVILLVAMLSINGLQKKHLNDLSADITKESNQLQGKKDISRVLTVQNQLKSLTSLHDQKPDASRLFDDLNQVTPAQVAITNFKIDMTAQTIDITGSADALSSVNQFVDSLKFTKYKGAKDDDTKPFKDIVLSSFALTKDPTNGKPATFTVTLAYDPAVFDTTKEGSLTVPAITSTRSTLGQSSSDLFQSAPASATTPGRTP